jgi:serine/threonine protein kinase
MVEGISRGSRLGPYEVLAPLGAGGMGEVYRARDPRLGREVAIKVLPASLSKDADRLRRFEREARAAGVLSHPNITAVFDIGSHEGAPYVVSELLEGEVLQAALGGGRLSTRKALDCAIQMARGLAAAHDKGIVHRDLKPENVFVTRDGRVKILDFGLAKLQHVDGSLDGASLETATSDTGPGVVLGTLGYMAPEQLRGRAADPRSDIFSFGAILYEMLTGNRAFRGDSAADTVAAILREDPPDLSLTNQTIPAGLDRVVRHCLEKNPEQRFQSVHDLAFDLEALAETSACPVISSRVRSPQSESRFIAAVGAAVAVAVALAAGYLAGAGSESRP